jgi:D-inositol-3-phosphate glycosyltransferase
VTGPWSELSERVVMLGQFNPRDGIGRYARQLAQAHGQDRAREFVFIGIPEGPGDYARPFHRGLRALWLLHDAARGDDIVIQYHPHYFIRGRALARMATRLSFGVVGLFRRVTYVAHEPDPVPGRIEEAVTRWAWRRARRVVFHSDWERGRHAARFGQGRRQRLEVVTHGDFFATAVVESRAEARATLGLAPDRTILLMIGLISPRLPDKGYARAIAAVRSAGDPSLELHIVGSPIRSGPDVDALLEELRAAAAESKRIVFREDYVDDHAFDLWIRAADAVLTPYVSASSSGVMARAQLLGTPVITSDVGGLPEQAGPADTVVQSDDELRDAVVRVAQDRRSSSSR